MYNILKIKINFQKLDFLLLSLISGILELGGVYYCLKLGFSPIKIILIGFGYQIGNLFPIPFYLKNSTISLIKIIILILIVANIFSFQYFFFLLLYVLLAIVLQSFRAEQKSIVKTSHKRISRIIGFLLSFNFSFGLLVVIIIALILHKTNEKDDCNKYKPKLNTQSVIMIIHQMHYFCYIYFIIIIVYMKLLSHEKFYLHIVFSLSWITYTSVAYFFKKKIYLNYLILGHIYLIVIFCMMIISKNNLLLLCFLWIMTGFGGGTVFCINKLNKTLNKNDIVFSENLGQSLGGFVGLCLYYLSFNLFAPLYLSAFFAFFVVVLSVIYYKNKY